MQIYQAEEQVRKEVVLVIKTLSLLSFVIFLGTSLYAANLDFSIGGLRQDPSGKIEYEGTRISIDDDLKLGKRTRVEARLKIEHPLPTIPNLYLQYIPMRFKGVNRIAREIEYGGRRFQANTDLYSELRLDHYDLGLYANLGFIQKLTGDMLDPELGLNVRLLGFKGKLTGIDVLTGQEVTESKSFNVPIPMLYAGLGYRIPGAPLKIRGEFRTLPVSRVKYYDLLGELRINPVKYAYLSLGYRYEKLKIDKIGDVYSDVRIKGPFIMVGVEF